MSSKEERLITVFSTSNKGIFLVAKSILEGSGIEYFTKHEYLEAIAYGADTQDIQVSEKDERTARKLLENIEEKLPRFNVEEKQKNEDSFRYTIIAILIIIIVIFALIIL